MKKNIHFNNIMIFSRTSFWLFAAVLMTAPVLFARAQGGGSNPPSSGTLENPLKGINTVPDFIKKIISDIILPIGLPIITFFIIYSGYLFVAARGDAAKLKAAKETFLYTVIGAAVILGAWILAQAIGETVKELGQ